MQAAQRLSRPELPRRFYKAATVGQHEDRFAVLLDGKPVRTPGRNLLAVADAAAAAAVAAEWEAQAERIDPATMPLTRILHSALDGVAGNAAAVRAEIVKYAGSDLVCYRADGPPGLVARQSAAWDPIVAWARQKLGARFVLAEGVIHTPQSAEALAAVDAALANLDPVKLAALSVVTTLTGSALIAVMLLKGDITREQAWAAAHVDEDWQAETWGRDAMAEERRSARHREMQAAATLLG